MRPQKSQVPKKFSESCVVVCYCFSFSSFVAKPPAFSIKGLVTFKVIFLTNIMLGREMNHALCGVTWEMVSEMVSEIVCIFV